MPHNVTGPREPRRVTTDFSIGENWANTIVQAYSVPSGKRFIIEYVSGVIAIARGGVCRSWSLSSYANRHWGRYELPVTNSQYRVSVDAEEWIVSQSVPVYADENSTISVNIWRQPSSTRSQGRIHLSGFLVDMP